MWIQWAEEGEQVWDIVRVARNVREVCNEVTDEDSVTRRSNKDQAAAVVMHNLLRSKKGGKRRDWRRVRSRRRHGDQGVMHGGAE